VLMQEGRMSQAKVITTRRADVMIKIMEGISVHHVTMDFDTVKKQAESIYDCIEEIGLF